MDEQRKIRIRKSRIIARRLGGQTMLAEALKVDPSQVSGMIGKNPRDVIGHKMARRIEIAGDVPANWLDDARNMELQEFSDIEHLALVIRLIRESAAQIKDKKALTDMKVAILLQTAYGYRDAENNPLAESALLEKVDGLIHLLA